MRFFEDRGVYVFLFFLGGFGVFVIVFFGYLFG